MERSAKESKKQGNSETYRWFFQQSRDILLLVSAEGKILDGNQAAIDTYGYSRSDLCRMDLSQLFAEGGETTGEGADGRSGGRLLRQRRKDETFFWAEVQRFGSGEEKIIRVDKVGRGETKGQDRQLQTENDYWQQISQMIVQLMTELESEKVLCRILRDACRLAAASEGAIALLEKDGHTVTVLEGWDTQGSLAGLRGNKKQGICESVFRTGKVQVISDYSCWTGQKANGRLQDVRTVVAAPLKRKNRVIGLFALFWREKEKKFSSECLAALENYARIASVAFRNAVLYREGQKKLRERRKAELVLKEREASFREFIENMPLCAFVKNRGGQMLFFSRFFAELFHLEGQRLLGKMDPIFLRPEDARQIRQNDRQVFEMEYGESRIFEEHVDVDGQERIFASHKFPFLWKGKKRLGAIAVDITEQKNAEQEMGKSERKFRALAENSTDVIVRLDSEGRYLYINGIIEKITRLSPEEFIGKSHWEIGFPAGVGSFWEEGIRWVFRQGTPTQGEFSFSGPGGRLIFDYRLVPEFGQEGQVETVMGTLRDVTVERRNQLAIVQSEQRYRNLFEHMQNGFAYHRILLDEKGVPCDYVYLNVNESFEKLIGKTSEEVIGSRVTEVLPGIAEDPVDWIGVYGKVALTGEAVQFEEYSKHLGRWYNISAYSPRPMHFAVIFADITDRKHLEEALGESKERYEAVLQQSGDAVALMDGDDGHLWEANVRFLQLTGYTMEELQGQDVCCRIFSEFFPSIVCKGKPFSSYPGGSEEVQSIRHKDGHRIEVEVSSTGILHKRRQLLLLSFRDVTEIRRRQKIIQQELELAGKVQLGMLPPEWQDDQVEIRTVYNSYHMVSGDFYGYKWSADRRMLRGYVLDVTGHGLATALQTSAVRVFLEHMMGHEASFQVSVMERLNQQLIPYFTDGSFAAIIIFEFDFKKGKLTYGAGGINNFLAASSTLHGKVSIPGGYMGLLEEAEFTTMTVPFQHGDMFYFLSDGIEERLDRETMRNLADFSGTMERLHRLSVSEDRWDDCSALCVRIQGMLGRPAYFILQTMEDLRCFRSRLRVMFQAVGEEDEIALEIAVNEGLANAVRHGNLPVHLKISQIGLWWVIRIRDSGQGFPGNAFLKKLGQLELTAFFENTLNDESGRGIPLMQSLAKRIRYNKRGTEVLLGYRRTGP